MKRNVAWLISVSKLFGEPIFCWICLNFSTLFLHKMMSLDKRMFKPGDCFFFSPHLVHGGVSFSWNDDLLVTYMIHLWELAGALILPVAMITQNGGFTGILCSPIFTIFPPQQETKNNTRKPSDLIFLVGFYMMVTLNFKQSLSENQWSPSSLSNCVGFLYVIAGFGAFHSSIGPTKRWVENTN